MTSTTDKRLPALAGFAPAPRVAGQSITPPVVAFRGRIEPGAVTLPALDEDQISFGLSTAPLVFRSFSGTHRIAANTPWALSRSRDWRVRIDRSTDLRLVHVTRTGHDAGSGPMRFDPARRLIVRAALQAATPVWIDHRLRQVPNLAAADVRQIRMLDPTRDPGQSDELRILFASLVEWTEPETAPDEGLHPVVRFIDSHLDDPALGTTLAVKVGVSQRTLQSQFAPYGGVATYIRRRRVRAAVELLTTDPETSPDLDEVARSTGLGSRRTLERALRDVHGYTPYQLRRRVLAGLPLTAVERSAG